MFLLAELRKAIPHLGGKFAKIDDTIAMINSRWVNASTFTF